MSTYPTEETSAKHSPNTWVREVPQDYLVGFLEQEDPNDSLVIEAHWSGESKVRATIDLNHDTVHMDLHRPPHWDVEKDVRPADAQAEEYLLGLGGIFPNLAALGPRRILVESQSMGAALALLEHQVPVGWKKVWQPDGWFDTAVVDARQIINNSGFVSFMYEKLPETDAAIHVGGRVLAATQSSLDPITA